MTSFLKTREFKLPVTDNHSEVGKDVGSGKISPVPEGDDHLLAARQISREKTRNSLRGRLTTWSKNASANKNCKYCPLTEQKLCDVLQKKCWLEPFRQFLQHEFSDENLEFWLDCESYRQQKSTGKRTRLMEKIYNQYLSHDSLKEVNIDAETRKAIEDKMASDDTDGVFDDAQRQIYSLMETDSFPRFQTTELAKCQCKFYT